jgi:signal transduction histidine kinase
MQKFIGKIPGGISTLIRSVRFRLTVWAVILIGVVLLAFSIFIYTTQARDLRDASLAQLDARMHQMESFYRLALVNYFINGKLQFPETLPEGGMILQDYEILALVDPQGQIIQKLGSITDSDVIDLAQSWMKAGPRQRSIAYLQINLIGKDGKPQRTYLFMAQPIAIPDNNNGAGLLLLGRPIDPSNQLPRLLITLIAASFIFIATSLAGGYWLAGRVMRPVQVITHAAREISETDLRRRLNIHSRDELGELANTFDQMIERLQTAFDRQRQFTADASHELRTPLTIVYLEASRALERRRSSEEYTRALNVIKNENEYMSHLVNDLLTLARLDAGQISIKAEELDLSDIALEVVERLAPLANQKGVQLSTGDLPEILVSGDRQYIGQMIANLVENAIKYVSGDGKRVRLETGLLQSENSAQGWVRVEDNGPGIAPEHLTHLFDRFYRVDQARSQNRDAAEDGENRTSGSGLGLSIVQWIAKAHGGEVLVQSEVGKGSVFEVHLPLLARTNF